MVLGQ